MADFQTAKIDWYKYNRPFSMIEVNGGDAASCAGEIDTFEQKGTFSVFPPSEFFTLLRADAARVRDKHWYGKTVDVNEKQFLANCLTFYKWGNDFFGR
jgi:hypothetical protein